MWNWIDRYGVYLIGLLAILLTILAAVKTGWMR